MSAQRNEVFDGLKFLLIVLVAVGHFSEPYRYTHSVVLGGYSVIYLFHMPLFILLSGYFSKQISLEKIGRTINNTWQAYAMMALASIFLVAHDWHYLLSPTFSNWYLLALVFWKIMLFLLQKTLRKPALILCLSLAFVPASMLLINKNPDVLCVMRTLCFFPFFVIGALMPESALKKLRSHRLLLFVLTLLVFVVVYSLGCRYIHELEWHRRGVYQLSKEYGYGIGWIFLCSLLVYLGSLLVSFTLMSISKLPQWMCKYGRYSLVFYVLQDVSWNINKLFPDIPMALQYAWCLLTLLTGVFLVEKHWQKWVARPISRTH